MGQPAPRQPAVGDELPLDPAAVERAYRVHRARRRARVERARRQRFAGVRFAVALAILFGVSIFLSLTVWREIEALFGL